VSRRATKSNGDITYNQRILVAQFREAEGIPSSDECLAPLRRQSLQYRILIGGTVPFVPESTQQDVTGTFADVI